MVIDSAQLAVADVIFTYFRPLLGAYGAIAAVVNAEAESGLNPNAVGDGHTSFGLWQMHADRAGAGKGTALQQCQAVWAQLQGSEQDALAGIKAAKSSADATRQWCLLFERPANANHVANARAAEAPWLAAHFGVK